ncbi:MAG: 2OG-Fe(II) oxygenase, partial [Chitinophagaceae bacterium]|nr:2OG-Fe(II) oxygenase [Chitinophagaceae bacterium]
MQLLKAADQCPEQRPRQQSATQVVPLRQGEGVIFAVRERPAEG